MLHPVSRYFNDGQKGAPKLQVWINLDNLADLRADSVFPAKCLADIAARDSRLAADGFEGVQLVSDSPIAPGAALPFCGVDRINTPGEADRVAAKHAARGDRCLTVHAGWGLEDDDQIARLVEAILTASDKHRLPIFLETHRATITQDIWRTVQITQRFPEIRFNGDFSHYYCGQEMPYGGLAMKLSFMQPIFERIGFLHGRIASPGCMQVPIGPDLAVRPLQAHGVADYLADFRLIWTHALRGFLVFAQPGDVLIFAPELLSGAYYYARLSIATNDTLLEETDRYAQALLYQRVVRELFEIVSAAAGP